MRLRLLDVQVRIRIKFLYLTILYRKLICITVGFAVTGSLAILRLKLRVSALKR
jgi:hypothetical protein